MPPGKLHRHRRHPPDSADTDCNRGNRRHKEHQSYSHNGEDVQTHRGRSRHQRRRTALDSASQFQQTETDNNGTINFLIMVSRTLISLMH